MCIKSNGQKVWKVPTFSWREGQIFDHLMTTSLLARHLSIRQNRWCITASSAADATYPFDLIRSHQWAMTTMTELHNMSVSTVNHTTHLCSTSSSCIHLHHHGFSTLNSTHKVCDRSNQLRTKCHNIALHQWRKSYGTSPTVSIQI